LLLLLRLLTRWEEAEGRTAAEEKETRRESRAARRRRGRVEKEEEGRFDNIIILSIAKDEGSMTRRTTSNRRPVFGSCASGCGVWGGPRESWKGKKSCC